MWQIVKDWVFSLSFVTRVFEIELGLRDAKALIQPLLVIQADDTLELKSNDGKLIVRIKIRRDPDART